MPEFPFSICQDVCIRLAKKAHDNKHEANSRTTIWAPRDYARQFELSYDCGDVPESTVLGLFGFCLKSIFHHIPLQEAGKSYRV